MISRRTVWGAALLVCAMLVALAFPTTARAQDTSDDVPAVLPAQTFVEGSWIEVYQDAPPWFGEDGNVNVLANDLGLVAGTDFGVNPTSALATGIADDVRVVIISSNSFGIPTTNANVNDPAAQANLDAFVQTGGILVMHLGDNVPFAGFIAPGLTEDTNFGGPYPISFTLDAPGHPLALGPDGTAGTADDLTQANFQSFVCCANGVLPPLPSGATVIISEAIGGQPVLAEYARGAGTVIVTTLTVEFSAAPRGILTSELAYALSIAPPANAPPVADIVVEQLTGIGAAASVRLDGSGSSDAESPNADLTFRWTVDAAVVCDGPAATCETIEVSLAFGPHEVALRVTDPSGASDEVTKTVTIDPAQLTVLDLDKVKVEFGRDPARIKLKGEIGLPSGVDFSELSPTATAGIVLAGQPVLLLTPVSFQVHGKHEKEWKFHDHDATTGIHKFDIDWKGARFKFKDDDLEIELESEIITSQETVLKFEFDDIEGPFSMDIGGLATVNVDAAGAVTANVPFEVEGDDDDEGEVELTLPFGLLDTMVITWGGSVNRTILVGDYLKGSIGRFRLTVNFDGALFPSGVATLPRTLELAMLVGAQGYDGVASVGPADLKVKKNKWEMK